MIHESIVEIKDSIKGIIGLNQGKVELLDEDKLRNELIGTLARDAVFGTEPVQNFARWLIWESGQILGARPASIHEFYVACAEGQWSNKTIPAMNIRSTTYDTVRAALRAAQKTQTGALIFEIARSEMMYTHQRPGEFGTSIIAAAIKEGFYSPLFIQGDHIQVQHSKFNSDPEGAIQDVKDLIAEAIPAGYWNIDIDTSTLVDLSHDDLADQQYHNFMRSAELTEYVRSLEPEGVTISLGGEIGEVGEKNSTVEELDAYMSNYQEELAKRGDYASLSKVSVQTGTSHGGVILADGSVADAAVDFDVLEQLSKRAHHYKAGGAVQHGASTLPRDMFTKFPEVGTLEIHLATGFTNAYLNHPNFPDEIKSQINAYLDANHSDERKEGYTDIQFQLRTRKKAMGPFKPELWNLAQNKDVSDAIYDGLEQEFTFYYDNLGVSGTRELVDDIVTVVEVHKSMPGNDRGVGDDMGLAD
ncbi:MAG: class II fructose-bisphosphate aldolase [Chloroflexota bacterium]